jgi:fructose-1,6-bisphosphatase/inositol monophosphatase family enzyme
MKSGNFQQCLKNFSAYGELTAFNLACVAEGLDIVKKLHEENAGAETVEQRVGEYKSWDPEIFKVDKDVEDAFKSRLEAKGGPVVLLSEEVGKVDINQGKPGTPYFAQGKAATCAVGDGVHRDIAFANENGAFLGRLQDGSLGHVFKLDKEFRKSAGRVDVTDVTKASVESYAMKPKKFMFPLVDEYRGLFEPFKFFLPNGGPYGFVDVATGKIDVYFALRQPFVDVFSGIFIAQQAGAVVTDFDGKPVRFVPEHKSVHNVVASTNPALHGQVIDLIKKCKKSA